MEEQTFKREMNRARTLATLEKEPTRAEYWRGYTRGLRRSYHGEEFGTEEEHQLFTAAAGETRDDMRAALGEGYLAGLAFDN